jgi:hypothetical protein
MLGGAKNHPTMPDLITIEKLVYGGEGLARVEGRVMLMAVRPTGRARFRGA